MRLPVPTTPQQLVLAKLRNASRVAVFTHQRPDPDALGSQSALVLLLQNAGKHAVAVNWEAPPRTYTFLQETIPTVTFTPDWAATEAPAYDTFLIVDTCTWQQLEPAADLLKSNPHKIAVLDHHQARDPLSDAIWSDPTAAAAVEVVLEAARALALPLTTPVATRLMAGLVTDTGWFRFDSVTPRTHETAAALLAAGADTADLYSRLQQNETAPKLALMARALQSITYAQDNRVAVMTLTQADFAAANAAQSQTEELVNLPLMVGTVEVSALISEMPDQRCRVSLRAKHHTDVNAICRTFGGGGHTKAAGCRLEGPPDQARTRLLQAIQSALK